MTQSSNTPFGNPEDEDLFDFPVSPAYADAARGGSTPEASNPEAATPLDATPVQPVTQESPQALDESLDPDEDLFSFDSVFEDSQPLATAEDLANLESEEWSSSETDSVEPPQASLPVPDPTNTDGATPEPKAQPTPLPAPGSVKRKARSRQSKGSKRAPREAAADPAEINHQMWVPPAAIAPEPKRGPLLEILAVSFLTLNTALILLAWRAGDHFNQTLQSVTRTVTDSVAEGHARGQLKAPLTGPSTPTPGTTSSSVPIEPDVVSSEVRDEGETSEQAPSDLLDMPRASLDLAQERIQKGRYAEARKGLYRLLSNRDRTALSDAMVIEAEVLIAQSYAVQSREEK